MTTPDTIHTPERAAEKASEESITLMAAAESFQIGTPEQYENSGDLLRMIKAKQKEVSATRTGITDPMNAAKKRVMDLFKPITDRLAAAEQTIKAGMLTFTRAEEAKRREAQLELDRLAAAERKRLEDRAKKAEAKGQDARAEVLTEAAAGAYAPQATAPTKAEGVHTRTTWKAEVTDAHAFIKAAVDDPNLAPYIQIDMQKLNALARSLKADMKIPGVRAVSEEAVAVRASRG